MSYYERKLPHWQPEGTAIFVTWRLHGSFPAGVQRREQKDPGKAFLALDRELDKAASGPLWLKDARIATCVVDALQFGQAKMKLYQLHAYVVMANHVHALVQPLAPLPRITRAIKGFTARQANGILGRTGQPFWLEESFDHWVRNDWQFRRIVGYIENNPVAAGLVERPQDWPWSSAAGQARMPVTTGRARMAVATGQARMPVATEYA